MAVVLDQPTSKVALTKVSSNLSFILSWQSNSSWAGPLRQTTNGVWITFDDVRRPHGCLFVGFNSHQHVC